MTNFFMIFFTLLWSGLVLLLDGWVAWSTVKQYGSGQYPSVTGKITHSELITHRSSKGGISYSAEISYFYTVGTQPLAGNRLRFNSMSFGSSEASAIVNAHPVGAAVTVYYNPAQPVEALLQPGIEGADFMLLLFLTPFNVAMLGFWIYTGGWLRERSLHPAAAGVKVLTEGMVTRVRLPRWSASFCGLGMTGASAFFSLFIIGFSTHMHPSIPLVMTTIAIVYGAGLAAYLWQWNKITSGIDDLVIDNASRTVQLPLTFDRKETMTVCVQDIESVWVEQIVHRTSKGGISYTYAPTLCLPRSQRSSQKLAEWSDQTKADDFAQWLAKQLGVPLQEPNSQLASSV